MVGNPDLSKYFMRPPMGKSLIGHPRTGSPVRVRRLSDNAEADIGFTAEGYLDTAALLAFVGAGNGFFVATDHSEVF